MRNPPAGNNLIEWCNTLIADGKLMQAERFARILHEDNSSNSLILLANILTRCKKADQAIRLLSEYLKDNPNISVREKCEILIAKGHIFANEDKLYAALDNLLEANETAAPESNLREHLNLDYYFGSLYLNLQDPSSAKPFFNRKFTVSCGDSGTTSSSIMVDLSAKSADDVYDKKSSRFSIKTIIKQSPRPVIETVYAVSGGLEQCRLFGTRLALQLKHINAQPPHLHIIGVVNKKNELDSGHSETSWDMLAEELKKTGLSVSLEVAAYSIPMDTKEQFESLETLEIYRSLSRIIQKYGCSVIITKLDLFPLHDLTNLMEDHWDIALTKHPFSELKLFENYDSQLSLFRATSASLQFADALEVYLTEAISQPHRLQAKLVETAIGIVLSNERDVTTHKELPPHLILRRNRPENLQEAYASKALFIGRRANESRLEFSNFLRKNEFTLTPVMLARALGTQGHPKTAIELLDRYLDENQELSKPEIFEIFQLRGLIYAFAGKLDNCRDALAYAQDVLPEGEAFDRARALVRYQLGSANAALGRFQEAQEIFNDRISIGCDNGWETHTKIVNMAPIESLTKSDFHTIYEKYTPNASSYVYFVAADKHYCQKFAQVLIQKLQKLNLSDVHLHIHGIEIGEDSDPKPAEKWDQVISQLEATDLSATFSTDFVSVCGFSKQQEKAVYASERFRILPAILEKYNLPVIVADIDQLPLRDPISVINPEFDAQILLFKKSVLNILSSVSATISVFRPSKKGISLAKELSGYVRRAYNQPEYLDWHVDQAALVVMYYTAEGKNIGLLPDGVVERNPNSVTPYEALQKGAYFWSATNSIPINANVLARALGQEHLPISSLHETSSQETQS